THSLRFASLLVRGQQAAARPLPGAPAPRFPAIPQLKSPAGDPHPGVDAHLAPDEERLWLARAQPIRGWLLAAPGLPARAQPQLAAFPPVLAAAPAAVHLEILQGPVLSQTRTV